MGKLILSSGDYILNSRGKDAIVNAANTYMEYGGGICGVIYNNAGIDELINYCKNTYSTNMVPSEVRITPGFNLGMDIIHVLAPVYHESKDPINDLLKGYNNMLNEIISHGYKNVLVCSLGTGIFGYKHEDIAKPLVELLNDFCNKNDINIYLNNMYPTYKDIYLKEYLKINNINLKDLFNLDIEGMKEFLKNNNLLEDDIDAKYDNFVKPHDLEDLCLSEKLLCIQYTLENYKMSVDGMKELLDILKIKDY